MMKQLPAWVRVPALLPPRLPASIRKQGIALSAGGLGLTLGAIGAAYTSAPGAAWLAAAGVNAIAAAVGLAWGGYLTGRDMEAHVITALGSPRPGENALLRCKRTFMHVRDTHVEVGACSVCGVIDPEPWDGH